MRDITKAYVPVPKILLGCPDCGGKEITLFEDFVWACPDCGCTVRDLPESYLSAEELIDFKAGMWTPKRAPRKKVK